MINVGVPAPICDSLSRCGEGIVVLTRGFIEHEAFGFSLQSLLGWADLMDAKHRGLIKTLPDS